MKKTKKKPTDPLDDDELWHRIIIGLVNVPMNYGDDVRAVGTLALAAGIAPCRAIAKVKTFYHHRRCDTVLH